MSIICVVVVLVLIPVYITTTGQDELNQNDVLAKLANVSESFAKTSTLKPASSTQPTPKPTNLPSEPPISSFQAQPMPLLPPSSQ